MSCRVSPFPAHTCSPACVSSFPYSEGAARASPPLLIPLTHCGWARTRTRYALGGRRQPFYNAPCGRRLRSLNEVHKYLLITGQQLHIDMFNFDWWLQVYNCLSITTIPGVLYYTSVQVYCTVLYHCSGVLYCTIPVFRCCSSSMWTGSLCVP